MNFQNGQYQVPGSCSTPGNTIPAVAFYQAQPEPTCPAPGISRIATDSQTRDYRIPDKSCRLELGDIAGNTQVDSLLVIGNTECFTDAELRTIFGVSVDTPIINPSVNCKLEHQVVEGALTFSIDGSTDTIRTAQFSRNAQQFLNTITNTTNCPFKFTRDNRCNPCQDGGEMIQSYGGLNCSPIVVGPQALFALTVVAGATLTDAVICVCAYSLPNVVKCNAPSACPPPPPAPPVCPDYNQAQPGNAQVPGAFQQRQQ